MIFRLTPLFFSFASLTSMIQADEEFIKRCGECWCGYGDGECPKFGNGFYDRFDDDEVEILRLLQPKSELASLVNENGEECFPFTHLGVMDKFPESELPPCENKTATTTTDSVCAFMFSEDKCEYDILTYESAQAATAAGAHVTHTGECGVCSSAQDLAVMGAGRSLDNELLKCSTKYYTGVNFLNRDPSEQFNDLVSCLAEVGYSPACARLWALSSATNTIECFDECSSTLNTAIEYNGPPPNCLLTECLQCGQDTQLTEFILYAGRTTWSSGITEEAVRSCDVFSPILHAFPSKDVCTIVDDEPTPSPSPVTSAGVALNTLSVMTIGTALAFSITLFFQ